MDVGVPRPRPERPRGAAAGRVPLAVVVVDTEGLVSHWSTGARRLFGVPREEAVGCAAGELLPVSGALRQEGEPGPDGTYTDLGPELDSSVSGIIAYPSAGRARLDEPVRGRIDVLWWAYPLVGPGPERLLVLAADAAQLTDGDEDGASGTIAPGFALHTDFPGYRELAGRLPEILPNMSVQEATGIVAQVLELGYPVLEFSRRDQVPVTPDWGVPRHTPRGLPGDEPRGRETAPARPAQRPVPNSTWSTPPSANGWSSSTRPAGGSAPPSTWNAPSAR